MKPGRSRPPAGAGNSATSRDDAPERTNAGLDLRTTTHLLVAKCAHLAIWGGPTTDDSDRARQRTPPDGSVDFLVAVGLVRRSAGVRD